MEIQVGAEVINGDGKRYGEVVKVIRDTWSGEITKFLVSDSTPANAELFSTAQVLEASAKKIRLDTNRD